MHKDDPYLFGLLGHSIAYSQSPAYFNAKFKALQLPYQYVLCDCTEIDGVLSYLQDSRFIGFNVTIPFKQQLWPWLESVSAAAEAVGAVNVLKRLPSGGWEGHNTDVLGFEAALLRQLHTWPEGACILGQGGAARAVGYVLAQWNIPHLYVSRTPQGRDAIDYEAVKTQPWPAHWLWIQATPLGSAHFPDQAPDLPYEQMGQGHTAIDLVYEPQQTVFLQRAQAQGAATHNGLAMLHAQAEAAWTLWQDALPL